MFAFLLIDALAHAVSYLSECMLLRLQWEAAMRGRLFLHRAQQPTLLY